MPPTANSPGDGAPLPSRHCQPIDRGAPPLPAVESERLLVQLTDWKLDGGALHKEFRFHDYYQTMAFVNALAWIAHREDHHPDLEVGYNRCRVHYTTHAAGGLSLNDFICAAKIDSLFPGAS